MASDNTQELCSSDTIALPPTPASGDTNSNPLPTTTTTNPLKLAKSGIRIRTPIRTSYTPPTLWQYDVFLSFRGLDTRHTFTDHLYHTLLDRKIKTFRDENSIPIGEIITEEIEKAIERSRFSIVVLSEGFANSKYCLEELAKITKCVNKYGHKIFPVFYHIKADDVSEKDGVYDKALAEHGNKFKAYRINMWRSALRRVPLRAAYRVRKDRSEGRAVRKIADKILGAKSKIDNIYSLSGPPFGIPMERITRIKNTEQLVPFANKMPEMSGPGTRIIVSIQCKNRKIQVFLNQSTDGQEDQVSQRKLLDITVFDDKIVHLARRTMESLISSGSISHVDVKFMGDTIIIAISDAETLFQQLLHLRSLENFFPLGMKDVNKSTVTELIRGGDETIILKTGRVNNNVQQKPHNVALKAIENTEESTIITERTNDCVKEEVVSNSGYPIELEEAQLKMRKWGQSLNPLPEEESSADDAGPVDSQKPKNLWRSSRRHKKPSRFDDYE